jgi:hypothetical protein
MVDGIRIDALAGNFIRSLRHFDMNFMTGGSE